MYFLTTLYLNVVPATAFLHPAFMGCISLASITNSFLFDVTFVFVTLTVITVSSTFIYLYIKKSTHFFKQRIHKQLTNWITKAILEEIDEATVIPKKFKKLIQKPIVQQYAIDELVATKKSLMGASASNIVPATWDTESQIDLYELLPGIAIFYVKT